MVFANAGINGVWAPLDEIELDEWQKTIDINLTGTFDRRNIEDIKEPAKFPEGTIPLTDGKPGSSEQVADLVLFLASDRASHITGTPIWIDGAESLLVG